MVRGSGRGKFLDHAKGLSGGRRVGERLRRFKIVSSKNIANANFSLKYQKILTFIHIDRILEKIIEKFQNLDKFPSSQFRNNFKHEQGQTPRMEGENELGEEEYHTSTRGNWGSLPPQAS